MKEATAQDLMAALRALTEDAEAVVRERDRLKARAKTVREGIADAVLACPCGDTFTCETCERLLKLHDDMRGVTVQ